MPTVVEVRSGRGSDSTRTPLSSRVACMRLPLRLLLLRLLERFLAGQPDLSRLVHLEHLDRDDVALLERVRKVSDVLKEGDVISVKVLEVDKSGKIRLSRKEALKEAEQQEAQR